MKKIMKEKSGFTLIELIIVIAIMGILAGVGTVAYTGYVKRANQAVDQQSVADLIYAVQLADYSDPNLFEDGNVGMIFLTDSGTVASIGTTDYNSDSGALTAALNNAVNLDGISLQYSGWGTSTSAAQTILKSAEDTGLSELLDDATVSFAENADVLWTMIVEIINQTSDPGVYLSQLAYYTSTITNIVSIWDSETVIDANACTFSVDTSSLTNTELIYLSSSVNALRAARNYSFGEYLSGLGNEKITDEDIASLKTKTWSASNDIYTYISDEGSSYSIYFTSTQSEMKKEWSSYLSSGQAKVDATAYYTLMKAINDVSNGEDAAYDPTSSTYVDDIGNYLLYGAKVCSGLLDLSDVKAMLNSVSGSSVIVIITAYKNDDGIQCDVLPTVADVRSSTSGQEDSNSSLEDDGETVYTEETVKVAAYTMPSNLFFVTYSSNSSFTTDTAYKITVEGGIAESLGTVSGSGSSWAWVTSSWGTTSGTLSLETNGSGLSVNGCEITAEQGASGTVKVTLTTSTGSTASIDLTFTAGS